MIRRFRKGASAVEFALTLPVLTTLFAAIMEYGWLFWQQQAVLSAVRDGVRVGVATSQADDPESVAELRAEASSEGFGMARDGTQFRISSFNSRTSSADVGRFSPYFLERDAFFCGVYSFSGRAFLLKTQL